MKITLDIECEKMLARFVEYMPQMVDHKPGIISDAVSTGLLSKWADSAASVPIEKFLHSEAVREVPLGASAFDLQFTPRRPGDPRREAEEKALTLASEWGLQPESVFLAAARVGLAKFNAQIQAQSAQEVAL